MICVVRTEYTMTKNVLNRWWRVWCERCGVIIEVGDEVVSKYCSSAYARNRRIYHAKCWHEMFI